MTTTMSRRVRRFAAGLLALAALGVAACGSTSSSSSSATTQSSSSAAPPATSTAGSTKNGIPQGPGAGDQDSDNHGAPSDGDGNI